MPEFDSLSKALAYIRESLESALHNEVFEKVKEVELSHIKTDVYGAYAPVAYDRRGSEGGFSDPDHIKDTGSGLVLEVVNTTPPNPEGDPEPTVNKNLAQVIETGDGYDYRSPGARPYHENTVNELRSSGVIVEALKAGLKKKGIQVK